MKKYNVLIISLILVMVILSGCSNEEMPPPDDPVEADSNSSDEKTNAEEQEEISVDYENDEDEVKDNFTTQATAVKYFIETESYELDLTEREKELKKEIMPFLLKKNWLDAGIILDDYFNEFPSEKGVSPLYEYYKDLYVLVQLDSLSHDLWEYNHKTFNGIETMLSAMVYNHFTVKYSGFTNLDGLAVNNDFSKYIELYDILKITDEDFIENAKESCNVDFNNAYMVNIKMIDYDDNFIIITAYIVEIIDEATGDKYYRIYKFETNEKHKFNTVKEEYLRLLMEEYMNENYNY